MERRAARQFVALDSTTSRLAEFGEVIRDAGAADAPADDHNSGRRGEFARRVTALIILADRVARTRHVAQLKVWVLDRWRSAGLASRHCLWMRSVGRCTTCARIGRRDCDRSAGLADASASFAARRSGRASARQQRTSPGWLADRGRRSTPLPGGLTNRNYRLTWRDGAACGGALFVGQERAAGDRPGRRDQQARAAAGIGVGPRVVGFAPRSGRPARRMDRRADLHRRRPGRQRSSLRRVAATCRRLHAGPRFVNDFDMFAIQRRLSRRPCSIAASGCRRGYLDFCPQVRAGPRGTGRARRGHGAVPQRSAGGQHHGRRASALVHRLRVLRQQRSVFRARQHLERGRPRTDRLARSRRRLLRPPRAGEGGARPAVGPDVEVRLDAVGQHPGRR